MSRSRQTFDPMLIPQQKRQQQQHQQQQSFGQLISQSQSTTPAQPISLANPTSYHLEQKSRREQVYSDGAPPTPKNSYPNNTVDPSMLAAKTMAHSFPPPLPIKQEELLDMELERNPLSPMTNSPLGSPPHHFDAEEIAGSLPGRIETTSQLGESPRTIYSPGPDTTEFIFEGGDSTPTSVGPMDMKQQMGNNARIYHSPPCGSSYPSISMSLPVTLGTPTDLYSQSFEHTGFSSTLLDMPIISDFHIPDEPGEKVKQAQLNFEKRRRRRESHNAVERRRRDNINEKIQELSTLLPGMQLDSNKPNKGVILRKSVDYIKELKDKVDQADVRTQELEALVAELRAKSGDGSSGEPIVL